MCFEATDTCASENYLKQVVCQFSDNSLEACFAVVVQMQELLEQQRDSEKRLNNNHRGQQAGNDKHAFLLQKWMAAWDRQMNLACRWHARKKRVQRVSARVWVELFSFV